jgi:hypothetical protein
VTSVAAAAAAAAQEAANIAAAQRAVDEAAAAAARYAAEAASAQRALDEAAASAARAAAVAAEHEAMNSATRCAASECRASDAKAAALAALDAAAAAKREEADSAARRAAHEEASAAALARMSAAEDAVERGEQSRPPPPTYGAQISPADFFTFSAPQPSSSAPPSGTAIAAQRARDEASAAAAQHHLAESAARHADAVRKLQARLQQPSATADPAAPGSSTSQPALSGAKKLSPSKAASLAMRQAMTAAATPLESARVASQYAANKAAAAVQRHEQLLEKHRAVKQWRFSQGAQQQWIEDECASEREMVRLRRAATEAARVVAVMEGAQAGLSPDAEQPKPRNAAVAAASRSALQRLPADSPPPTPPLYESDDDPEQWGARPWSSDDDTSDRDRLGAAAFDWGSSGDESSRGSRPVAEHEEERTWRTGADRKTDDRDHAALLSQREVAVTRLQSVWRGCLRVRTGQRHRAAADEEAISVRQAEAEVAAQLVAEASEAAATRLIMELAVEAAYYPRCSGGRQRRKQRVRRQRREATMQRCVAQAVDCSGLGAVDCQGGATVVGGGRRPCAHTAP